MGHTNIHLSGDPCDHWEKLFRPDVFRSGLLNKLFLRFEFVLYKVNRERKPNSPSFCLLKMFVVSVAYKDGNDANDNYMIINKSNEIIFWKDIVSLVVI